MPAGLTRAKRNRNAFFSQNFDKGETASMFKSNVSASMLSPNDNSAFLG